MDRLPGIIQSKASYREGNAVVEYDPAQVTTDEMVKAIDAETYYKAGQPVPGGDVTGSGSSATGGSTALIQVDGMTDQRTASLVSQALGNVGSGILLPGAEPAILDVSLVTSQRALTVTYDPDQVSAEELVASIQKETGFETSLISTASAGGGGVDYTPYVVLGIAALFVAAVAWPAVSWGRRQLARDPAPARGRRRQGPRRRRRR